MPRPTNTARIVISGSFPSGESFAWGFWMNGAVASEAAAAAAATAVANDWGTYLRTQLCSMLRNDCAYLEASYYAYGSTTGPADFVGVAALTTGVGTGAGTSLPLQCSVVASLRTTLAGRRNRGRMYIPITAAALVNHQLTSADTAAIRGPVAGFLTSINANGAIPGSVAVVSQVVGVANPVTSVIVNSQLDIQRRRAEGQLPLFTETGAV